MLEVVLETMVWWVVWWTGGGGVGLPPSNRMGVPGTGGGGAGALFERLKPGGKAVLVL